MKRGAYAMDGDKERCSNSSGDRGDRRSDQDRKRPRHADAGRSRYGPVTGTAPTPPNVVAVSSADKAAGANGSATVRLLVDEKETDPHRLAQRQKQIDYGKNTLGYDRYCAQVPRHQRRPGKHPMTPDKTARIGKKVFDGRVRQWRQALHTYDPPELVQANETPAPTVAAADRSGATSSKQETPSSEQDKATGASASTTAPAGHTMKPDSAPAAEVAPNSTVASVETPPTRSIYENFEEGEFDQEDSDDDDLL